MSENGDERYRDEHLSLQSLKRIAKAMDEFDKSLVGRQMSGVTIDTLGDDVLLNILGRLPAISFAAAATVSRCWNYLCERILSTPKLSSAISLKPSLQSAVEEVLDKVLSEPIRPHFVLASVFGSVSAKRAFMMISTKFSSKIPIIVNKPEGVLGQGDYVEALDEECFESKSGILLTVGFLPGLKINIVPLMSQTKGSNGSPLVDEFLMDIKEYASAVSGSSSPVGLILYAGVYIDIKPVLQKIELAVAGNTFVVGDGGSLFFYRCGERNNLKELPNSTCEAVTLLFARDINKSLDIGEIEFHSLLSTGMFPIGHKYKAVSVKRTKDSTWLTASRNTLREHLDGEALFQELDDEHWEVVHNRALYIGVKKNRKYSILKEKSKKITFLDFHYITGGDEEYLFVQHLDIKTGDEFRFYVIDPDTARSSCDVVAGSLTCLKQDNKRKVFGGLIFACCGRDNSFFGQANVNTWPFVNNFPDVCFGGTYCSGEIGRGCLRMYDTEDEEGASVCCSIHSYSTVYLVMSYVPPANE